MNTPNQSIGANDFILQESPTSRDVITVAKGNKLAAGAVVMQRSDGRYQPINDGSRTSDGITTSRTTPAVVCTAADATATDMKVQAIVRNATVDPNRLVFPASFDAHDKQSAAAYLQMFLMTRLPR